MTLADYSSKFLRRVRNYLCKLNGGVMRSHNDDPSLRREPVEKVTFDLLEA